MSFQQVLSEQFLSAIPETDFVQRTVRVLGSYGFTRQNSIACVDLCRDEITQPLAACIQQAWGEAFNYSSLGGMLFLGTTGFRASQHHSPLVEGRERYLFFAMPHIAIGETGEMGICFRPGRSDPSSACGALIAFQKEIASGHINLALNPDDIEQSLLKQRLFPKLAWGKVPDLPSLTRLAYDAVCEDLEHMIKLTVDDRKSDFAAVTGVQIHGPQGGYVWPGNCWVSVGGVKRTIEI